MVVIEPQRRGRGRAGGCNWIDMTREKFGFDREEPRVDQRGPVGSLSSLTNCFGYTVRSTLSFTSLRNGPGAPLDVRTDGEVLTPPHEALLEWTEAGQSLVRLYVLDSGYLVWIDQVGWFRVDPHTPAIAVTSSVSGPRLEARVLGLPTALCFMHRGDLPIHAAAVDVGGSALILAAPGRFGKSTLAASFVQVGRPLSEDTTCLRFDSGPTVVPGLAMLRIRPDVYERLEFPGTHVIAREPDRVYLTVDENARGDATPVPLKGVVFLRRAEDRVRIELVPTERALPDLWTLSFHLPTDEDRARCFSMIAELARQVPVWDLHRPLSFQNMPEVMDTIISTCLR
jgi:hypothetical protein